MKKQNLIKLIIGIIITFFLIVLLNKLNSKKNSYIKKDESLGSNIYTTYIDFENAYNVKNQNKIEKEIKKLKTNKNIEEPLIIYNAYGLNPYSCNFYFTTKENVKVSYKIEADGSIYENNLYNEEEYSQKHKYQIIGLVPGYCNNITLITENIEKNKKTYTFEINLPEVDFPVPETRIAENTEEEISEGLFVYLDSRYGNEYGNIYCIDNDAIVRSVILVDNEKTKDENTNNGADCFLFNNGFMYYTFSYNKVAKMNRLGQVVDIYEWDDKYVKHHDMDIDFEKQKIFILASDYTSEERLNLVLVYDMKTRQTEIINLSDIFLELYEKIDFESIKDNRDYKEHVDLFHLNTVDIDNDELTISSRSLSAIIVLKNIYETPEIKYIIAPEEVFEDTKYEDKLLSMDGEFPIQLGQHTTKRFFADGEEYISLYNNNYGNDECVTWVDWGKYGRNNLIDGTSYYYLYKINNELKTFTLVEQIPVRYSPFMSSTQQYKENKIVSSLQGKVFGEYNENGEVIRQYEYKDFFVYRVFKYDFNEFWFRK